MEVKSPLYLYDLWDGETNVGTVALYFWAAAEQEAITEAIKPEAPGEVARQLMLGIKFTRTSEYKKFPWANVYEPFTYAGHDSYTLVCSVNEATLTCKDGLHITYRGRLDR
jgi:hypothetical protein